MQGTLPRPGEGGREGGHQSQLLPLLQVSCLSLQNIQPHPKSTRPRGRGIVRRWGKACPICTAWEGAGSSDCTRSAGRGARQGCYLCCSQLLSIPSRAGSVTPRTGMWRSLSPGSLVPQEKCCSRQSLPCAAAQNENLINYQFTVCLEGWI